MKFCEVTESGLEEWTANRKDGYVGVGKLYPSLAPAAPFIA
jgi:hypothetical protein